MQTSANKIEPPKEQDLNQTRPCNFSQVDLVDSKGRFIIPKDDRHFLQMMDDYADDFDYFLLLQGQYLDSRDKFYHFKSMMLQMYEIIKMETRANDQSKNSNTMGRSHKCARPVKNRAKDPLLSKRGFCQHPRFITKSRSRSKFGSSKFALQRPGIMKPGEVCLLQKGVLNRRRMQPTKKQILLNMDLCRLDYFESRVFGEGFRDLDFDGPDSDSFGKSELESGSPHGEITKPQKLRIKSRLPDSFENAQNWKVGRVKKIKYRDSHRLGTKISI